jgi:hypothetical protein
MPKGPVPSKRMKSSGGTGDDGGEPPADEKQPPASPVEAAIAELHRARDEAPAEPDEMTRAETLAYRGPVVRVVQEVSQCNINGRRCDRPTPGQQGGREEPPELCVAKRDTDCREALWACKLDGQCTARDGECVAGSDADCEQSYRCRRDGWCTARDGKCVAGEDDDCRQSEVCEVFGFCEAVDGACTLPAPDRRELVGGVLEQPAGFLKHYGARPDTAAGTVVDIGPRSGTGSEYAGPELPESAPRERLPAAAALEPFGTVEDCSDRRICEVYGRCSAVDGECVVRSDENCRGSAVCEQLGRCRGRGGECVAASDSQESSGGAEDLSCTDSPLCDMWGRCTESGGDCIVGSSEDCRRSWYCKHFGRCEKRSDRWCKPDREETDYLIREYSESGFGGYRLDRERRRDLYRDMTHLERAFVCREVGEPFAECRRD